MLLLIHGKKLIKKAVVKMNKNILIGCINNLTWKTIKTRWFLLNKESNKIEDVTGKLYKAINSFNKKAEEEIKQTGNYSLRIPYSYKNGLTGYSFGCGLSHYLENDVLSKLGFNNCRIEMYTPKDIKYILKCTNVWDINIQESLLKIN
jgi:hypothetical protein